MFVNVDMCEITLITSESTEYEFSAAIFIELLKFWCEVLTIVLGYMRMSGDVSGAQMGGWGGGGGRGVGVSPVLFWKLKKLP